MAQKVLYKFLLLAILSSLQSAAGQSQEEQPTTGGESDGLGEVFDEIKALLLTIKSKTGAHRREFLSFKEQLEGDLRSLRDDLNSLNDSVNNLSDNIQEHRQQRGDRLAELQTSLTNTNSKLDTLNATTAQLSTDLQEIQANISNVECLDAEEFLQLHNYLLGNVTQQVENEQENVTSVAANYTCGGAGGWRRAVYLDMTDPNTTCPSGWQLTGYSKRTCGKVSTTQLSCDSVTFPVHGGGYSRVCGRIKAYQYGPTDAFEAYHEGHVTTIDRAYVAGVSVTHGSPRQHVWTFAAGIGEDRPTWDDACPCDASISIHVPPFVGEDYFCESGVNAGDWDGFHPDDPLWDGQDCTSSSTCCSFNSPPYFDKQLPTSTTDDIEARLCLKDAGEDVAVELIQLYVQ